jgi:adenylate cyclase class IV
VSGSHDELELKARVDDPVALERLLLRAGAQLAFRGAIVDRRYDRGGALGERDEVLRLRICQAPGGEGVPATGVLSWKGPVSVRNGYKHREERETRVADPDEALAILERLGYDVVMRIDRTIAEYRLGDATVRIERYPAMDVLVEVEGEPDAIERAVAATGLARDRFLPEALPYFVAEYEARTGRRARIAADAATPPAPLP